MVLIGNRKWIREKNFIEIPADVENKLQAQEQLGHTAILVAVDGKAQCFQMAKMDPFVSLDCARVESVGAQSKERKGSNFAAQRSGAIVQKPEGPNTY